MDYKKMDEGKKQLFAELMKSVMKADGKITVEEETFLKKIYGEIDIPFDVDKNNDCRDIESITEDLKKTCNRKELRTFAFEAVSLVCVDRDICELEQQIIDSIKESFQITDDDIEEMYLLAKSVMNIEEDIQILINR